MIMWMKLSLPFILLEARKQFSGSCDIPFSYSTLLPFNFIYTFSAGIVQFNLMTTKLAEIRHMSGWSDRFGRN